MPLLKGRPAIGHGLSSLLQGTSSWKCWWATFCKVAGCCSASSEQTLAVVVRASLTEGQLSSGASVLGGDGGGDGIMGWHLSGLLHQLATCRAEVST